MAGNGVEKESSETLEKWKEGCRKTIEFLEGNPDVAKAFEGIVGFSDAFRETLERVILFADSDDPVLVCGESGIGKESVARALHQLSSRREYPFIAHNCATQPDAHFQRSELFGHKVGAFTGAIANRVGLFEQANGGTIFLDEIGWLKSDSQAMLNRVVERGERNLMWFVPFGEVDEVGVDVRIVAAFNRALTLEDFVLLEAFPKSEWERRSFLQQWEEPLKRAIVSYEKTDDVEKKNEMKKLITPIYEQYSRAKSWEGVRYSHLFMEPKEMEKRFEEYRRETGSPDFNEDLAYRLRSLPILIPPLRKRLLDAVAITTYYMEEMRIDWSFGTVYFAVQNCQRGNARTISSALREYSLFPVDQKNEVRKTQRTISEEITSKLGEDLGGSLKEAFEIVRGYVHQLKDLWKSSRSGKAPGAPKDDSLSDADVLDAMLAEEWIIKKAAERLHRSPSTLKARLKSWDLTILESAMQELRSRGRPRKRR